MSSKLLFIAGGGILLWLVSRAKSIKETVQFLEYTPGKIKLKFEGLVPVLTIRLDIYNPNRTSVPMNGVIGQLYFKGRPVASFVNKEPVNINGNETSSVDMKVKLSLFNTAVALFTKEPKKEVVVDGLIKTAITDIPFNYSYDFTSMLAKKNKPVSGARRQGRYIDAFTAHRLKQSA